MMKYLFCFITVMLFVSCSTKEDSKCISLFNGKDLTGWKVSGFGGDGEVSVIDGEIFMDFGNPITGITYTNTLPKINYEITLEANKISGNDFFLALTAPYQESHFSLVLGGWGGLTSGISSIGGFDASENDTSFSRVYEKNKWYKIKLTVTENSIKAYIDDQIVVNKEINGEKIGTRPEVDVSKRLGLAAFATQARYRNIQLKMIKGN